MKSQRLVPGQRFGRLTVESISTGRITCVCVCGGKKDVAKAHWLLKGKIRSCGCLRPAVLRARNTTHGLSKCAEYQIWAGIIQRCTNPRRNSYASYGGRGITICERWRSSFESFLSDVGGRPSPELTIDRIDNNKGYQPGNVHWATNAEQGTNKRTNRRVTIGDKSQTISQWAREKGFCPYTLYGRFHRGMTGDSLIGPLYARVSRLAPRCVPCAELEVLR